MKIMDVLCVFHFNNNKICCLELKNLNLKNNMFDFYVIFLFNIVYWSVLK